MSNPANQPTLADFQTFISNVMQVPSSALDPTTAPVVQYCYDFAIDWVYDLLGCVPTVTTGGWSLYARAVYNLAADTLINWAQDASGAPIYKDNLPYWAWLRDQYGVNNFVAGVIQSTSDEGTSAGYVVPEAFKEFTMQNLGNLKTPYGRQYLSIVQSWGQIWGIN